MAPNDRWQCGVQLLPQRLDLGVGVAAVHLGAAFLKKLDKLLDWRRSKASHPLPAA
jgi:hypothetical protein